jgi:hypothetical protein
MTEFFMFKQILEEHYGEKFGKPFREYVRKWPFERINETLERIDAVNFFVGSKEREKSNYCVAAYFKEKNFEKETCGELEIMLKSLDLIKQDYKGLKVNIEVSGFPEAPSRWVAAIIRLEVYEQDVEIIANSLKTVAYALRKYKEKIQETL